MLRLLPRTFNAGPDISTFFLRFSGFTQSILSLLLKTLYVSIKSPLILLSCNVVKLSLFNLSSYSSFSKPVGILVALLCTLLIFSIYHCKCGFQACTAYSKCGLTREKFRSFHSPGSLLSIARDHCQQSHPSMLGFF